MELGMYKCAYYMIRTYRTSRIITFASDFHQSPWRRDTFRYRSGCLGHQDRPPGARDKADCACRHTDHSATSRVEFTVFTSLNALSCFVREVRYAVSWTSLYSCGCQVESSFLTHNHEFSLELARVHRRKGRNQCRNLAKDCMVRRSGFWYFRTDNMSSLTIHHSGNVLKENSYPFV